MTAAKSPGRSNSKPAKPAADVARRFEQMSGVALINGLGATEVLHIVLATAGKGESGSTGRAVPGATHQPGSTSPRAPLRGPSQGSKFRH